MKKLFKTALATFLSCACLFGAAACANKSECNTDEEPAALPDNVEIDERMTVDQGTDGTDGSDCPDCPEDSDATPCPDCPDCPEIPEKPDHGKDKDGEHKPCPQPRHRRARFKLLPFEIVFGESEEGFYYVFLPAVN